MQHLISSYKYWFELKNHIPKTARYTLAGKVESLFVEVLELIFIAQYLPKEQKLPILRKAIMKFDTLKFFTQILWETKNLSEKHYELISLELQKIGKMLWSWKNGIESKTPTRAGEH